MGREEREEFAVHELVFDRVLVCEREGENVHFSESEEARKRRKGKEKRDGEEKKREKKRRKQEEEG